jgi:hypothetical protein
VGANITWRTISDYGRRDANMEVRCRCGNKGVLDARKVDRWFMLHGWNTALEVVPQHLRCRFCRKRPIKISPTPAIPDRPEWMRDERKWKELARRQRG